MSVARPSCRSTRRSPPGKRTSTSPSPCVAAATATALEPDAVVSPTPRSHTRALTSPGPSMRATCTFVRSGKRGCVSNRGPMRGSSFGSPRTTACGLPTETRTTSRPSIRSGGNTSTSPRSDSYAPAAPDPLRREHLHLAELRLVQPAADAAHVDDARADVHSREVVTGALHEPRAGDARSVPRHLRVRSIRIHDRYVHGVAL